MAKYTRKTTRRSYRSRRTGLRRIRRRYNISKSMKTPRPVSFKRTVWMGNWTPSTASTSGFWRYFTYTAGSISNWSEYATLFDQYRINGIKVTFRPRYDGFNGNDTTDTTLPGVTNQGGTMIHLINDPTSSLTPAGAYGSTTLQTFLEQGNVRSSQGNKPFSVYFRPHIENTVYGAAGQRVRCPWLQTKDNGILMNGFHAFLQDINMTGTFGQSFDLYATFYFQCRSMN